MDMASKRWVDDAPTHGMLLLVTIIWGLGWTAGRTVASGVPEATGAWVRYAIASAWLLMYMFYSTREERGASLTTRLRFPEKVDKISIVKIGFFSTLLYQLFYMYGMHRTAAGEASLIITMNPVFTALLAIPMLGRNITGKLALGLLIGVTGVVVVSGWSPNTDMATMDRLTGDVLIVFAALSFAISTNLVKRILETPVERIRPAPTPLSVIVWASFFGWFMLLPFALIETVQNGIPTITNEEWFWISFLAIISTGLSYVWYAKGVDKIGSTATATYVFLVPFFGVLFGWLILDEQLGWGFLVGFVLILLGVRMVQSESIE
jgi:drug/metabolite transporter (DMT)-like permease